MSHSLFISLSRHTALEKNRPLLPPSNLPGVVFVMLSFIRRGSVLTETKAGGLPMQQRRGLFVQFRMLRFTSKQNKKPAATGHSHGRAMHALVSLLVGHTSAKSMTHLFIDPVYHREQTRMPHRQDALRGNDPKTIL